MECVEIVLAALITNLPVVEETFRRRGASPHKYYAPPYRVIPKKVIEAVKAYVKEITWKPKPTRRAALIAFMPPGYWQDYTAPIVLAPSMTMLEAVEIFEDLKARGVTVLTDREEEALVMILAANEMEW